MLRKNSQQLTFLSEIQMTINSKPSTYRSSTEGLEFITPNYFLKLLSNSSLILRNEVLVDDLSQSSLKRTLELQEEILENF